MSYAVTSRDLVIKTGQGESFKAFCVSPTTHDPAPVVLVIQEIFGVNDGLRGKCVWLAQNGFIAIAPDLFWRLEPNVELSDQTTAEWNKAIDLMTRFDLETGLSDLCCVVDHVKEDSSCSGKVGCLGYCLGGKLAYLMAARSPVDASVGYYGVGLEDLLGEAKTISHPLLLHIAGEDAYVRKEAQEQIIWGLKDYPQIITHRYEGVGHAFTRVGGVHYNTDAARLADGRSIDFLRQHLV